MATIEKVVRPENLGNTLDLGTKEATKIHVNIDEDTIVRNSGGILSVGNICPAVMAQLTLNWNTGTQSVELLCSGTVISSATVNACDPNLDLTAVSSPANGATDVPGNTTISVTFPEVMAATTSGLLSVTDSGGGAVTGSWATADNITFTFTPSPALAADSDYTISVEDSVKTAGPPSCPGIQGVQTATFHTQLVNTIYGYRHDNMEFGYLDVAGTVYTWTPLSVQAERLNAIGIIDSQNAIAAQDDAGEFVLVDLATGVPTLLTRTNFSETPDGDDMQVGTYGQANGIYYAKEEGKSRFHSFTVDTVAGTITYDATTNLPNSFNVDDFAYLDGKLYGVEGDELRIWDIGTSTYSEVSLSQSLNQSAGIWVNADGTLNVLPDDNPAFIYEVSLSGVVTQIGTVSPANNWDNDKDDFGA